MVQGDGTSGARGGATATAASRGSRGSRRASTSEAGTDEEQTALEVDRLRARLAAMEQKAGSKETALRDAQTATKRLEERCAALEHALDAERTVARQLQDDKRQLRQACVSLQLHAEQDEEFISNSLLKRIQALEAEKQALEEQGKDTLQLHERLEQLRKEKVEMENHLEQESEYAVMKLTREKTKLEAAKARLEEQLRRVGSCRHPGCEAQGHLVRELANEVFRLRRMLFAERAEDEDLVQRYEHNEKLREDNLSLKRRLQHATEKIDLLEKAKLKRETDQELDEERMFNLSRSSASSSRTCSPAIPIRVPGGGARSVPSPTPFATQSLPSLGSPQNHWWLHGARSDLRPPRTGLRSRSASDASAGTRRRLLAGVNVVLSSAPSSSSSLAYRDRSSSESSNISLKDTHLQPF